MTQPLIYSRRRRSKRLAGLMIVAVWILAGAITSPPLLGCFPRATNRDSKKCSYNMDSSYVIFSACGSFFLPMLVMLYVYGRISCVIAGRHRNLETSDSESTRRRTRNAPVIFSNNLSFIFPPHFHQNNFTDHSGNIIHFHDSSCIYSINLHNQFMIAPNKFRRPGKHLTIVPIYRSVLYSLLPTLHL